MNKKNLIYDLFQLENKTVVLTGSSGRLGSQYAHILSAAGANVVLVDKEINKNNFLELPELIRIAVKKGKVSQYQINEYWADIGNLEDLKLADQLYSSLTES